MWCGLIEMVYLQRGHKKVHPDMCVAPVVFRRSSRNADLKSQPILLLSCFIIEGPRWQMFIHVIPHRPESYVFRVSVMSHCSGVRLGPGLCPASYCNTCGWRCGPCPEALMMLQH